MGLFNRTTPDPDPAQPSAAPPPAPNPDDAPVTRGEFNRLDATLNRLAESMEASAGRPVVVQAPPSAMPPEPEITDTEINDAIAEGKGADVMRRLLDRAVGKARQEVASEVGAIRDYGTTMLGTLADRAFIAALDADDKSLFKRFEKEIRSLVNQCEPALRGHPQTWETAFNTIVGTHRKELDSEAREAVLRQQANDEAARSVAPQPGAGGRPRNAPSEGDDEVPTIQELAGPEFAGAYLGDMSEEEFIRKINRGKRAGQRYKDWNDYIARGRAIDQRLNAIREGEDDTPAS